MTKPHEPTEESRQLVSLMMAAGIPEESIARCIGDGISPPTLRKYYAEELATAADKANAKVIGQLFNNCMKGDTSALIFWAKTRCGWKEPPRDVNVNNTGTITHEHRSLSAALEFLESRETGDAEGNTTGMVRH